MRSRSLDVIKDRTGSALVEFAIVFPLLVFLILGLAQFGLIFYNYILVTNAAATGARQLSISRWDPTPYTDTVNAINNATTNLSGLTITLSVNGTACTSDSSCSTGTTGTTGLQNAPLPSSTATPWPSSVTVTYAACSSTSMIMPISLINLTKLCSLTSTIQQPVQ